MQPRAKKPWWRRWFGSRAERAAAQHLKKLGWRILVRNFTCNFGGYTTIWDRICGTMRPKFEADFENPKARAKKISGVVPETVPQA